MKAVLYYAAVRRSWGGGFVVGAVTSEKQRQVYFRFISDNEASHCTKSEVCAKYVTKIDAERAVERANKCAKEFNDVKITAARKALHEAEQARADAIAKALLYGSATDADIAKFA